MKLSARKDHACIYAELHIQHDGSFDTEDLYIKLLEGRIALQDVLGAAKFLREVLEMLLKGVCKQREGIPKRV